MENKIALELLKQMSRDKLQRLIFLEDNLEEIKPHELIVSRFLEEMIEDIKDDLTKIELAIGALERNEE